MVSAGMGGSGSAAPPKGGCAAGRQIPGRRRGDRGGVTVEAAIALSSLVLVLMLCVVGLSIVLTQMRCADAAREVARLAARGDSGDGVMDRLAPPGSGLTVTTSGSFVSVVVAAPALPGPFRGLTVRATAVAADEGALDGR